MRIRAAGSTPGLPVDWCSTKWKRVSAISGGCLVSPKEMHKDMAVRNIPSVTPKRDSHLTCLSLPRDSLASHRKRTVTTTSSRNPDVLLTWFSPRPPCPSSWPLSCESRITSASCLMPSLIDEASSGHPHLHYRFISSCGCGVRPLFLSLPSLSSPFPPSLPPVLGAYRDLSTGRNKSAQCQCKSPVS